MKLNELRPQVGAKKTSVRKGRGTGSGLGKTGGRGQNGDHSRSGSKSRIGFEGGQTPLQRRLPKKGFKSRVVPHQEVTLRDILRVTGDSWDPASLAAAGLVRSARLPIKLIGKADVDRVLVVRCHRVSIGARALIEKIGGRVELLDATGEGEPAS